MEEQQSMIRRTPVDREAVMPFRAIYRACIWLPIVVPIVLIAVVNSFDLRHSIGVLGQLIAYSIVIGGLPYLGLAIWSTWWVGRHSEAEIRRLMWLSPLIMLAVFVPLALMIGIIAGQPGPFAALALLGGISILLLGYGYVALTVALRFLLGPRSA